MPSTSPAPLVTSDMPIGTMLNTAARKLLAALLNQVSSGGTWISAALIALDMLTSANGKPGWLSVFTAFGKLLAHGLADNGKNAPTPAPSPGTSVVSVA